jgi:hypothetical protein
MVDFLNSDKMLNAFYYGICHHFCPGILSHHDVIFVWKFSVFLIPIVVK